MTERPILFSGPMVRAILDGRKCQTRRIVKLGPSPDAHARAALQMVHSFPAPAYAVFGDSIPDDPAPLTIRCPYGAEGDRLWVRETWGSGDRYYREHESDGPPEVVAYAADRSAIQYSAKPPRPIPGYDIAQWNWDLMKWRPSIHMPRWASRLLLEVTCVRAERLQAITERDARAEGVLSKAEAEVERLESDLHPGGLGWSLRRFRELWDSINGKRASWASNPWVWAISFRRVEA